jgi:predicted RNase H-like HicB family nuclease
MTNTYTAIIQQDGDWWIGWFEEVPNALAQERTRDELITSLKEVLGIMLEVNREQARDRASAGYEEIRISA